METQTIILAITIFIIWYPIIAGLVYRLFMPEYVYATRYGSLSCGDSHPRYSRNIKIRCPACELKWDLKVLAWLWPLSILALVNEHIIKKIVYYTKLIFNYVAGEATHDE